MSVSSHMHVMLCYMNKIQDSQKNLQKILGIQTITYTL